MPFTDPILVHLTSRCCVPEALAVGDAVMQVILIGVPEAREAAGIAGASAPLAVVSWFSAYINLQIFRRIHDSERFTNNSPD